MIKKYSVYWGIDFSHMGGAICKRTFLGAVFSIMKLKREGYKVFSLEVQ